MIPRCMGLRVPHSKPPRSLVTVGREIIFERVFNMSMKDMQHNDEFSSVNISDKTMSVLVDPEQEYLNMGINCVMTEKTVSQEFIKPPTNSNGFILGDTIP